jgi:nicotinamidase-related amidase
MKANFPVLIVVDPQMAYFNERLLPVAEPSTIYNIAAIAQQFVGHKILIEHVQAGTPFELGAPGSWCHPALDAVAFDQEFQKGSPSAIRGDLRAQLEFCSVQYDLEIVLVGYQTDISVMATAFDACDYGTVFVVHDACSSPDEGSIPGQRIHNAALSNMIHYSCQFPTTADVLDRFCSFA